jgi:hypothetical protein
MNRSTLERELKKAGVSLKGWLPALECDVCKKRWLPFSKVAGANTTIAKLDYWRCPNECNAAAQVSHEVQTATPKYVEVNDIPGMIFGAEDLAEFEQYVRSMDATQVPNRSK